MEDNLFEMLMNFFDNNLSQLDDSAQHISENPDGAALEDSPFTFVREAKIENVRIFMDEEKLRLSPAAYQYLLRAMMVRVLNPVLLEQVMMQVFSSESRFISSREIRLIVRNILAEHLDAAQLAFLDLVLCDKENDNVLH